MREAWGDCDCEYEEGPGSISANVGRGDGDAKVKEESADVYAEACGIWAGNSDLRRRIGFGADMVDRVGRRAREGRTGGGVRVCSEQAIAE